jgi:hypothetical protein
MDLTKLKPFDLEAAKRGEPVVTRGGEPVLELHYFETATGKYPLAAVVGPVTHVFTADGFYDISKEPHHTDLFMAPRKQTVYVNLYSKECVVTAAWHETAEKARQFASEPFRDVTLAIAVPIEIEV